MWEIHGMVPDDVIQFYAKHGVLKRVKKCEKCGDGMALYIKSVEFHCQKVKKIKKGRNMRL